MSYTALTRFTRPLLGKALHWAALAFVLNLAWEIAQLPLYTIARDPSVARIAYAVLHCTLGDAIIAAASFLVAGFALKNSEWPLSHPRSGGAIATAFGLIYTAYSEWVNVYQVGSWSYLPDMPLVFGIGVSPLLQWLVIPAVTVLILRGLRKSRMFGSDNS